MIVSLVVAFYPLLLGSILSACGIPDSEIAQRKGVFGDMYGALNTLFSGFAFAFLLYTIRQQGREISTAQQQIELARKDAFEQRFFKLLDDLRNLQAIAKESLDPNNKYDQQARQVFQQKGQHPSLTVMSLWKKNIGDARNSHGEWTIDAKNRGQFSAWADWLILTYRFIASQMREDAALKKAEPKAVSNYQMYFQILGASLSQSTQYWLALELLSGTRNNDIVRELNKHSVLIFR